MEPWFFVFVCISGFNGLTAPYVSHNAKKKARHISSVAATTKRPCSQSENAHYRIFKELSVAREISGSNNIYK
jgi:hypothetical protein